MEFLGNAKGTEDIGDDTVGAYPIPHTPQVSEKL